jgi:hypothetical protein
LEDWKARFAQGQIYDESDRFVSVEDLLKTITERSWPHDPEKRPYDYDSWDEMLRLNYAVITPQGLLKSVRRGSAHDPVEAECDGTYQMFDHEFS